MSLEVIGAGWSRTGTFSLRAALNLLGLGPCHHMHEVFQHPEQHALWRLAAAGQLQDWSTLLGGYRSVTDAPACLFWRELARTYPEAKVILTVRDPVSWYDSMRSTIYEALAVPELASDQERAALSLARELVFDRFFAGKFAERQTALALFDEHNSAVRREVARERLLVYEVSQGWGPLCEFLGTQVPSCPFPNTNARAQFRRRARLEP
jgi:hypothetical protein